MRLGICTKKTLSAAAPLPLESSAPSPMEAPPATSRTREGRRDGSSTAEEPSTKWGSDASNLDESRVGWARSSSSLF